MKILKYQILRAVRTLILFSLVCGVLYTLLITVIGQSIFSSQANGSMIVKNGVVVGSKLMSQPFHQEKYLWGRMEMRSDAFPGYYYAKASNQAVADSEYQNMLLERAAVIGIPNTPIDLLTGSGSGFDPDISLDSALVQTERIARARNLKEEEVLTVIQAHTGGLPGHRVVNVLETNLALDELTQ